MSSHIKRLKNIVSPTLFKRKFVNGPQRIVYVVQVRTEQSTSVGYLHTLLCFVTCDIQLNDIGMIYKFHIQLDKTNGNRFMLDSASVEIYLKFHGSISIIGHL